MKLSNSRRAGATALGLCALLAGVIALASNAAASGPAAAGQSRGQARVTAAATDRFWSGTDSNYVAIPHRAGSAYREPAIGGSYGGYIGMIGNWASWQHCGGVVVWSKADSQAARINHKTYHQGIGVGAYWFMAGPGVDPHYNGRQSEANAWGQAQAAAALKAVAGHSPAITYPVIIMDVELPGDAPRYTPAQDNGWNAVYTSPCSGRIRVHHVPANLDRAVFNGFAAYLTTHSKYKAGVYSAPGIWADIMGTGRYASLSNTYEWTYTSFTSSLQHHPSGWCLSGTRTCAHFFGGISSASKYALIWQWSGGGGSYNGYGDFDQIDGSRTP
jgi:hypothetical protein